MPNTIAVRIHSSQFPGRVEEQLKSSLRARELNHKFLYDGHKQTQKWLRLHEACSPARTDPGCLGIYDDAFRQTAENWPTQQVHLIGLGCGGGQKDVRLVELLLNRGLQVWYTPIDVSAGLAVVAAEQAGHLIPTERCHPLVADLLYCPEILALAAEAVPPEIPRLVTFFGMLPNFEPGQTGSILSRLQSGDRLLVSANLAPGPDYATGVANILPQYDNAFMRDWLNSFITDLGVTPPDGDLFFEIAESSEESGLKRIVATFCFTTETRIATGMDEVIFPAGGRLRVFFSYRHTPKIMQTLLGRWGIDVAAEWVAPSGEEAVFLGEINRGVLPSPIRSC